MNTVERAAAQGATFEQRADGKWSAIMRKRGRALPLAAFLASTKEEAAEMWLQYKEHSSCRKPKLTTTPDGSPIRLKRLQPSTT
jgi:hypothetical protein